MRCVHVIGDVERIILSEPADCCSLDPGARLWLHFLGSFILHLREALQFFEPFQTLKLLGARHNNHSTLLVDI